MVKESDLELALKYSWSKDTTLDEKNWAAENPSWGQCAVTALVVNDYLGGEIVWALAKLPDGTDISHYFNKIKGEEKDYTRMQFPEGTQVPAGVTRAKTFASTREYILSYESTRQRYELLKGKVSEFLKKQYL
ncbi:hypothetical protein JXB28_04980 [Candidatus Woesearchaeota archaeon]|nr:hypothetical protein [Candidatus Woesearchaeota archaeon]